MWGKIVLRRLAGTLEIILYMTLHKLIGLKSVTDVGFLTLGMSAIYVEFSALSITTLLRKKRTALQTSGPTMSQCFWKKLALYPSGLGGFSGAI